MIRQKFLLSKGTSFVSIRPLTLQYALTYPGLVEKKGRHIFPGLIHERIRETKFIVRPMQPPAGVEDLETLWFCVTWTPPLTAQSDEPGLSSGVQKSVLAAFEKMFARLEFYIRRYERRSGEGMRVVGEEEDG